jgi:uncharacterized protein (DUF169 family)
MSNHDHARELQELLGLRAAPIAIAFRDAPPDGVPAVERAGPAGCAYWRLAMEEGRTFYTRASDHFGCPVGAHTHAVPLPDAVRAELQGLIETMVGLEYLSPGEVPAIPTRQRPMAYAVYAPLATTPVEPDVVLLRANARQMMLLQEAALSAGLAGGATLGRPTCAVLPQAENTGRTASSFGCVGNRVYTGAADDEAYFAIPGPAVAALLARLAVVARANAELELFHRARAGA